MKERPEKNAGWLSPLAILFIGLLARLILFGQIPGGINQDEAFAGYEAWCLLNYGRDTAGYSWPVYLTAWGSGMNALESYLMMPFIALFGLETWVIRLPQLIVGCLGIWVCYLTVKKLCGDKTALWAMVIIALCPWHVMLSRWGLESNLAPAFLLFGLYFFIKATEKSAYLILSALMYGLSLYCYATIWVIVPFLVLGQLIYCLANKLLRLDRYMLISAAVLFLLALPLLLFLTVNYGLMEEIKTSFISVPKLLYMRAGEISLKNIPENLKTLFLLLINQSDGLPWNSMPGHGLIYFISAPFALLGIACSLTRSIKERKEKSLEPLLFMQLAAGIILGMLVNVNVNRVNIIFIPLIIYTAIGISFFSELFGKWPERLVALLYALLFVFFVSDYFGEYRESIGWYFDEGLEEALEIATEEEKVYLPGDLHYPKVLFYTEQDIYEFDATVEYRRYPAAYLSARSFGKFVFGFDAAAPDGNAAYVIKKGTDTAPFLQAGFVLYDCGNYFAALMP